MPPNSAPVLVLTPEGRDPEVAAAILREAGIPAAICRDLDHTVGLLPEADCAIVAEEALLSSDRTRLADWIGTQPPWSDFPFVLLTFREGEADPRLIELLGNVTVLERPFHPSVLVSAVRSAARARRRQREAEVYLEERKRAEEHKELLIRELHHRVKNTLATVLALLRTGSRPGETVQDFKQAFTDRILSLSRTHGLLVEGGWRTASLRDILWNQLGPFEEPDANRIALHGPSIDLPPALAMPLGMAVHELATNAAKYGSLSVPQGALEVTWSVASNGSGRELDLTWTERHGPAVSEPSETGFGSILIRRVLTKQCGAEFRVDYARSGLVFRLHLPLDATAGEELPDSHTPEHHAGEPAPNVTLPDAPAEQAKPKQRGRKAHSRAKS